MAAATSLSTFGGTATPPTNFVTPTGKSDMAEASGVATPTTYAADCAMVYTGATYANGRFQVQIKNEFKAAITLLYKLASSSDLTADHGEIVLTPGSSVAPAWNVPDTITFKKRVSGTTSTITPTNTANGVPSRHPSIVGNTISLRHQRIAADDVVEVDPVDDQVFVRINHVPYALEQVTGLPSSTEYVGLISHSGAATTQAYDNARGGALVGRYVNKDTGSDSNSGLSGAPWATLQKGVKAQAAGEFCFVESGAFTEDMRIWNFSPTPRTATSFEDPLILAAKAGATVTNTHGSPWDVSTQHPYTILYNLYLDNSNNTSVEANITSTVAWRNGTYPHMMIGGAAEGSKGTGIFISAGAVGFEDHTGGNRVMDVRVRGNGRFDFHYHNFYIQTNNNIVAYCDISGASSGRGLTQGYGIHCFWDGAVGFTFTSGCQFLYNDIHDHSNTGNAVAGILIADGTDIIARGNRVYNNPVGIAANFGVIDPVVETNLVYDNSSHGVHLGASGVGCTGAKVRQNTITGNGGWGLLGGSANSTTAAKNNIIWNNTSGEVSGTGITETTNFKTDPDFVGAGVGNYMLNPGTADTGATDISGEMAAWHDINGYAKPQGATPSYGAFEIPNPATNPLVSIGNVSGNINTEITLSLSIIGQGNDGRRMRMTRSSADITVNAPSSGSVTVKGGN